jgi:hypothetical protein
MNAFVKKEIRLLLPSFLAVLALATLAPWFSLKDPDVSFAWTPIIIFFGVVLLGMDSFGREFSLGTFSSLMAQPIERRQIWRTKIAILFSATALIFTSYFISSEFLFHHALKMLIWKFNPKIIGADFRNALSGAAAAILIALDNAFAPANRRCVLDHVDRSDWIVDVDRFGDVKVFRIGF